MPCTGSHDQFVKWLGPPAVSDEPVGEEVEQWQLQRGFGLQSEVTGIIDEGFGEVMHPDSVHPDASSQGVAIGGDGIGEVEAAGRHQRTAVVRV